MSAVTISPSIEITSCPLCARKKFTLFDDPIHLGIHLRYQICQYCGLVFMSPCFSESDLTTFYREEYRLLYSGNAAPTEVNLREQSLRAEHLTQILKSQISQIDSHLDIGCSAGELLLAVRNAYPGVISIGIEPSEAHRSWVTRQGLTVYPSLEDVWIQDSAVRFNLVSMSHVLEHIVDPLDYLKTIRSNVLSTNGFLMIEVPNLLGHGSYELAHPICFWEKTLKDMLEKAGFRIIFQKIHSIPRKYEAGERYITVISVPISDEEAAAAQINRVWWRAIKLRRRKGLSGHTWLELALRAPRKVHLLLRDTL